MYYAIGTRIDLSHIGKPDSTDMAAQFEAEPKRRLYVPGTKILIVRMFPTLETITVAPAL